MQKHSFLYSLLLFSALLLSSCKTPQSGTSSVYTAQEPQVSEHTIQAVLWQQTSAEYRALSYQAFNFAKIRLAEFLEEKEENGKKAAIITDIDETVMDNMPSSVKNIEENEEFSEEEWARWVHQEKAEEVPGAAEFLNYAAAQGVEVFYVSNRVTSAEAATLRNMKSLNFPFADAEHLFLRTTTSSKKERFEKVLENYDVLLYLGDNLSDFSHKFGAPSIQERYDLVDELKEEFGRRFIVLPNPIYGDWETKGVFEGKYDWNFQQKDSIRRAALKSY